MLNVLYVLITAAAWLGLQRSVDLGNFLFGAFLGIVLLKCVGFVRGEGAGFGKTLRYIQAGAVVSFWFIFEIIYANIQQLKIIFAPKIDVSPMWIRYPSELESPRLRAILGMMISMTPGTITCSAQYSDRVLIIHVISADDEQETVDRIRDVLEKPLRRIEQI